MATIASSAITQTTATSIAVTAPSGVADGDLILIWIGHAVDSTIPTPPSAAWKLVRETVNGDTVHGGSLWWKIASGEGASWTFTGFPALPGAVGALAMRITGHDATDPFYNAYFGVQTGVGSGVAFTWASPFGPTFLNNDGWLQIVFEQYQRGGTSDGTTPSGYNKTSQWDQGGTGAGGTRGFAFWKNVTPSEGYQQASHTPANGVAIAYVNLFIRPSGNTEDDPRYVGSIANYSTSAGSLASGAPPPGTRVGDVLVAFASKRNGTTDFSTPSGWNLIGSSSTDDASPAFAKTFGYWRISDQDQTGAGWTFSLTSSTAELGLIIGVVRGGYLGYVAAFNTTPDNTSDTTHNIGALTLGACRMWLFTAIATNAQSAGDGSPSGYRLMKTQNGGGSNMTVYAWQKYGTTANPPAVSTTGGSSRKNTGFQLAIGGEQFKQFGILVRQAVNRSSVM